MIDFNGIGFGAEFIRADLHIHSYGSEGSYDVTDTTMTPENIVDISIQKNLSIISITDHNEIGNVKLALLYAEGKNILIIPGIEVSTTQGHLLLYFESFIDLKNFTGKLNISSNKERCQQGIVECLALAEQFNGIGILAHIELASGFEQTINRFGPLMNDIFLHPNLWGLEISNKVSINNFTELDENDDRKLLSRLRREKLNLDYELPKIISSDSHTLVKLGTNAEGENKLTRLKLESLSFQSFKIALLSNNSRVRLEICIPERIPKFIGMKIEGGILDNEIVKFSNNLTCIIGGRGTGKSTLLESLREGSGNKASSKVVDSEVWPDKITLIYQDETGQEFELTREKNGETINSSYPSTGINKITIESYGQGDTAETIQHSDQNPKLLIDFLDSFILLKSLKSEDEEIRQLLIDNQSEINKLRIEVANIPETEKQKLYLENKLEQLKKDKVGELVKFQTSLLKERDIRKNIINDLNSLVQKYKNILADNSFFKNFEKLTDSELIIGKEFFCKVKTLVFEFSQIVDSKSKELNSSLNLKIKELKEQIDSWNEKETQIQQKIDEKKIELSNKGIPFDIGKINQIANDLLFYQNRLIKLQQNKSDLDKLLDHRDQLIKRRIDIKDKIFYSRLGFATTINENLRNTVDGLFVSVKYSKGTYSPQFEEELKNIMQWKTVKVPKAFFVACNINPLDFVKSIKNKKLDFLKNIEDQNGIKIFNNYDINLILQKLLENNNYEYFESLTYEDKPFINVTKYYIGDDGTQKHNTRNLAQLSLGQQQSVLLAILLQSKSKVPLIIDQPEDNLDSEFIYKTIVTNLRRIKEYRQVIIVTHNPNIAVLGDAELILPLKSSNIRSRIYERGSIDKAETRSFCCDILEGGKQAFIKRKCIYGI